MLERNADYADASSADLIEKICEDQRLKISVISVPREWNTAVFLRQGFHSFNHSFPNSQFLIPNS